MPIGPIVGSADAGARPVGELVDPARRSRAARPTERRPPVEQPFRTTDLPPLPQRDRRFPASLWLDAPDAARHLGDGLGAGEPPDASYLRRIGRWLLWRAGPASGDAARYLAVDADDLTRQHRFDLGPDGTGSGDGPDGVTHTRFRTWKEALRDA